MLECIRGHKSAALGLNSGGTFSGHSAEKHFLSQHLQISGRFHIEVYISSVFRNLGRCMAWGQDSRWSRGLGCEAGPVHLLSCCLGAPAPTAASTHTARRPGPAVVFLAVRLVVCTLVSGKQVADPWGPVFQETHFPHFSCLPGSSRHGFVSLACYVASCVGTWAAPLLTRWQLPSRAYGHRCIGDGGGHLPCEVL